MSAFQKLGRPTRLNEGAEKVTGKLRFTPDVFLPNTLHARFVASPYAHARILSIDAAAALAVPGVHAVLTARDLPDIAPSSRAHLLLARDRVIFAGQPVALVLAESEASAEDGAEQVLIDFDPLPTAMTIEAALAPDAPLVWPKGIPGSQGSSSDNRRDVRETTQGDVSQGFAAADVTLERTFTSEGVHQSYIEPQAVLVQPDPLGGVTIWTNTQAPFEVQEVVAEMLGLPESRVRVIPMPVGGGFGGKFTLYQPLVVAAALAVNRPVRLVLSRMEELAAGNPAPAIQARVRLGAKQDGTLTALEADILVDAGCYPSNWLADFTGSQLRYCYHIPHYRLTTAEILTFKASVAAYRAPCAPTAALIIESLMDELAERLNRDPLELREQNLAQAKEGQPQHTHGARQVLQQVRQHPLWQNRAATKANGRGVGLAFFGWTGAYGPSSALCMLQHDGRIQLQMASVDLNGTSTGFQLMVAEALNIPLEAVSIVVGDTLTSPYAVNTAGSMVTYSTGGAVLEAAKEVRQQILAVASDELEVAAEDLEIVDGRIQVKGYPSRTLSFKDISARTRKAGAQHPPILAHGRSSPATEAPVYSAQLAEVEVDRDTGEVKIHRIVLVQDVGFALNPLAIQGQMHGGVTQGIGWALYEQLNFDEGGQLLTGSWMDYAVPRADQTAPVIETVLVEVASDHGPLGARGVGESPVIATAAATANAMYDATGIRFTRLPMTAPRVWSALKGSQA